MKHIDERDSFAHTCTKIKHIFNHLTTFIVVVIGAVLILGNLYIHTALEDIHPAEYAETVIVLGAQIQGSPLQPSLLLKYRLNGAYEYWKESPKTHIIVSGGKTQGYNESEAAVMKAYLVKKGIPADMIIEEDLSTRTAHQFINSAKLKTLGKTVVITNDFHLPRAMMLAKRSGLIDVSGLATETPRDTLSIFTAYIREPFALLNSWLFDHPSLK